MTGPTLGIDPIDWTKFWGTERDAEDFILPPLVASGRQTALYGPPKGRKSLLVLDAVASAVTGRPIFGQQTVAPFDVVYVDLEMTEADLRERLLDMGYGEDSDLSRLHYYQLQALPPLDGADGGTALLAVVERHGAKLVVLDTMSRAVCGEENSADTYRNFYAHTGKRLKAAGVGLLRLDHQGHDGSHQRGSSAKADDVDTVYKLTPSGNRVTLVRTHSRVPWMPEKLVLAQADEGHLRHVLAPADSWPAGTADLAIALDELDLPLDASAEMALRTLRAKGQGRRKDLVLRALEFRRTRP